MDTMQDSVLLQFFQIATDCGRRDIKRLGKLVNTRNTLPSNEFSESLMAFCGKTCLFVCAHLRSNKS